MVSLPPRTCVGNIDILRNVMVRRCKYVLVDFLEPEHPKGSFPAQKNRAAVWNRGAIQQLRGLEESVRERTLARILLVVT